jgi:hypothetical protein
MQVTDRVALDPARAAAARSLLTSVATGLS